MHAAVHVVDSLSTTMALPLPGVLFSPGMLTVIVKQSPGFKFVLSHFATRSEELKQEPSAKLKLPTEAVCPSEGVLSLAAQVPVIAASEPTQPPMPANGTSKWLKSRNASTEHSREHVIPALH
jgi:hypothetical protein